MREQVQRGYKRAQWVMYEKENALSAEIKKRKQEITQGRKWEDLSNADKEAFVALEKEQDRRRFAMTDRADKKTVRILASRCWKGYRRAQEDTTDESAWSQAAYDCKTFETLWQYFNDEENLAKIFQEDALDASFYLKTDPYGRK